MKQIPNPIMAMIFSLRLWILAGLLCSSFLLSGQEETKRPPRPVDDMFESIWLGDNQTALVPFKGTLEMDMLHRFGTVKNGYDDFWGLYASSNIRIGFNYVAIFKKVQLAFGLDDKNFIRILHRAGICC